MEFRQKTTKAFTLAEILISFFIIGIVATIVIPHITAKINGTANSALTYSAFSAVQTGITEEVISTPGTVFDSALKVCNSLANQVNTLTYSCTSSSSTMTFANGIKVTGISYTAPVSTITIDIDGTRTRSDNSDIIKVLVTSTGTVLPSGNAENVTYLAGRYGIDNNGTYTWKENNISYKQALCKSGAMIGVSNCSSYCGSTYCSLTGTGLHADCKTGLCEPFINRPLNLK